MGQPSECGYCGQWAEDSLYSTQTAEGEAFFFTRCRGCDAVSLAPRPTTEQLLEAYSDTYYGPGDTKFIAPIESVIDYFRAQRSRRISRMLPAAGRVLDIGCGNGRFLRYLAKRGFEAHGIELPGKAADRASEVRGLHIHVGESGSIDFPSNSFDIVTMWHVLEHLTEPKVTLERVFRWLTPGGRLVLSLPNVDSWQSHVFKGRWLHHDPPRHLVYLGPKALTRNLAEIGFSVAGESYFSLEQNPFGLQQSLLNCFLARRDALFESLRGNAPPVGWGSLLLQKLFFVGTFPLAVGLASIESIAKRGGTMEFVFVKPSEPAQATRQRVKPS